MADVIDILSTSNSYPEAELSNFYPYPFEIDGVKCGGMEGFLQSLKFFNKKKQLLVCALSGKKAKKMGEKKLFWKLIGRVYWQGKIIKRQCKDFDHLISLAYNEMYKQNKSFRDALAASRGKKLAHSIGSHDKRKTILTEEEFISRLEWLRELDTSDEA